VLPLALVHGHWAFIQGRERYYWPNWWFLIIRATRPSVDTSLGGMLRSRHARLVMLRPLLFNWWGVGRDEFSEGSVSK
jgi:hypothetical protein